MPDPIRIRSGSAWLPDRIRLAKTWHNQPELNQIRLVLHSIIRDVCGRTEPSLKVGNWLRAGCILPEIGPDDSCTPACFRTGCVWPKPWQNHPDLAKPWQDHPDWIRLGLAQYDPCLLQKSGTETDAGSRIWYIRSGPILAARWP